MENKLENCLYFFKYEIKSSHLVPTYIKINKLYIFMCVLFFLNIYNFIILFFFYLFCLFTCVKFCINLLISYILFFSFNIFIMLMSLTITLR